MMAINFEHLLIVISAQNYLKITNISHPAVKLMKQERVKIFQARGHAVNCLWHSCFSTVAVLHHETARMRL
ncbi:hypothetical protein M3089_03910 [Marseilla massiliensis]|nr:hypothetical protein [Marseilla massiliensis]